ncbi:50S ribosomal protein L25 [Peptoniphilus sp. KCTC 25270]|uniref:50S ribosomal protein L25 n=1 Tax=Peptoniphilus sp. KCTC 25270 TaxID=2897414 RepID=UPI001E29B1FF|nr:50S ribosomal protein L25 [Peptoniphilus sp. KCTC 25270]MCD1146588.1 50S ribosomal protein L25 [Peptoniphilus sp. KCTC 25270]
MSELKLNLMKREDLGKNKVDKMRNEEIVPGVLYSKGEETVHVAAKKNELEKIVNAAGTSTLVDVDLDGTASKVLFKDVQMHPYKNQILHFDAYGVNLKEKLKLSIPVVLQNRDNIKVQPSVLMQLLDEVEVECLPTSLPSEAVVDVENMEIGDTLTVADLDVSSIDGIEVLTEAEEAVASLNEPKEEVIEEEVEGEEISAADVPTVDETETEEDAE